MLYNCKRQADNRTKHNKTENTMKTQNNTQKTIFRAFIVLASIACLYFAFDSALSFYDGNVAEFFGFMDNARKAEILEMQKANPIQALKPFALSLCAFVLSIVYAVNIATFKK